MIESETIEDPFDETWTEEDYIHFYKEEKNYDNQSY